MNYREPPHLPAGVRRALHCLSLLLLPALAPDGVRALPHSGTPGRRPDLRNANVTPYLPTLGAPPLRIQEASPPPDLVTRPAAAAPPTPALTPTEASVALANAAAARSAAVTAVEQPEPIAPPEPPPAAEVEAPAPAKTPPPILPDEARPTVRPEDFLPYFQIPGSSPRSPDVTLLVPAVPTAPSPAATLPPSSATYTQSPK
jgi:hypothetical protein